MHPTLRYYMSAAKAIIKDSYTPYYTIKKLAELEDKAAQSLSDNDLITLSIHINNLMGNKCY